MTRESRRIAPLRTVRLTRPLVRMAQLASNSILETSLELDSHADTTVLGGDALIFQNYDRPVEVLGYDPAMGARTYQTVSGALAFDHPMTGQTYLLVFHQAISMPHLDHHLLRPMHPRPYFLRFRCC